MTDTSAAERSAIDDPKTAWTVLTLAIAAMVLLPAASTGANIAFPEINADLGSSRSVLSWIITGYTIATAAFTLLGGQLSDRLGSKRMFLSGLALFLTGALISAIAPSVAVLIAGRLVQGVGGALFLPSSLALVLSQFPQDRHSFVIGLWAAAIPIGSALSPTLTAWGIDAMSWRWVFGIQAILAALVFVGLSAVKADSARHGLEHQPDYLGVPIGTAAVGLLALGIVQGPRWGWTSGWTLAAFAGTAVLLPIFISRVRSHAVPLLDLDLFSIPSFRFANLVSLGVSLVGSSVWLLWPIHLKTVWGYSDFKIGLAITPTPFMAGVLAVLTGKLVEKHGYRPFLIVGVGSLVLANLWFVFFYGEDPNYWGAMFPGLVLYGMAMGLSFVPLNGAALMHIDETAYGRANAAFNTGRALAGAMGIAMLIAIIGDQTGVEAMPAFDRAFVALALVSAASLLITVLFWPRKELPGH